MSARITRIEIMAIVKELGIKCEEKPVALADLPKTTEVFDWSMPMSRISCTTASISLMCPTR